MDAKIRFGIDYLNIMANANTRSGGDFNWRAYRLSRLLLCWEWGFTSDEEDEANKVFFDMVNKNSLEDLTVTAKRVIEHIKSNEEAKSKLIVDMMMVNMMDGNVSDEEAKLTLAFVDELDFRKSEVSKMEQKAHNLLMVLDWYVDNHNK